MSKVLTRRDFLKLTASGALGLVLSELGAGNDDGYIRIADNEVVLPDQQLDPLNLVTNEQLEQKRMNWRKWIPPEFEPQTQVEKDCRITRYLGTPLVEEIDKDIQNSVPGYAIILPELLEIRLGGILDPQKELKN